MKLFSQENCAEFSSTQSILFLGCQQVCLILKFSHFDPFRFGNFCCPWQASTGDNNFVVNVRGDAKAWKEPFEEVEAVELRKNDQRRCICYDGHALRRSVDRSSSSRSSWLYRSGGTPCFAAKSMKAANGVWQSSAARSSE